MAKSSDTQLEKLKKQHETLMARIQACQAKKRVADRKEETRRKILVGSYYLDLARKEGRMAQLQEIMENYLTRPSDKKLFDFDETNKILNEETKEAFA